MEKNEKKYIYLQLLLENERLHQQLETARRQISEKTER